ncbi:MAG: glycosyltransferase family 4 protein [Parcubacteria group bacterium]|nr:glycosyltransferase family 4 protein [Parcubacteria group bacterium]MCR4342957.1 glycosyltransferase family 4 protein [Patescibacteria group bacterium]
MKEDRKKKIIYLITKSSWGGATRYVFDLATSLPKDDFEVMVLSGGGGILNEKLKYAGIKTVSIEKLSRDINLFAEIKVFFSLLKLFRKERPDVVHLNSSKAGGLGVLSAKIAGVRNIIFTAHGWAFNEDRPFWQKTLIKIFVWVTLLLADNIICVSEATKENIKNFPFVYRKTRVIYNGIPDFDLLEKNEARTALKNISMIDLPSEAIWIGTLSELHKNKGLEYAIKAISLLRDYPIVFLIIGGGELKINLEEMIKKEKLEQKVILLGFIDNAKRYLKAFDIFLLSSITEAFPYSIIEAGFVGLPVVSSSVGGVRDVISSDCGVLVKPADYNSIKIELESLLKDKEKREKLGVNLKQKIENSFSFKSMITQTTGLYL